MKVNIPVRFRNPWFWVGVASVAITAIGVDPQTFTSWAAVWNGAVSSLPSRERGLKYNRYNLCAGNLASLPSRSDADSCIPILPSNIAVSIPSRFPPTRPKHLHMS